MNQSWDRACWGKQPHESKDKARAHMTSLLQRGNNSLLEVYLCHWCDKWHVGHRSKGRKRGRRPKRKKK